MSICPLGPALISTTPERVSAPRWTVSKPVIVAVGISYPLYAYSPKNSLSLLYRYGTMRSTHRKSWSALTSPFPVSALLATRYMQTSTRRKILRPNTVPVVAYLRLVRRCQPAYRPLFQRGEG